jgi:hypothetical protein
VGAGELVGGTVIRPMEIVKGTLTRLVGAFHAVSRPSAEHAVMVQRGPVSRSPRDHQGRRLRDQDQGPAGDRLRPPRRPGPGIPAREYKYGAAITMYDILL